MPATLQYDLSVIGFGKVNAALTNVERRMRVHNQRVTRASTRGPAALDEGRLRAAHAARMAQIEAASKDRMARRSHAAELRLETDRHRRKLRNIEDEARAGVAAARAARAQAAVSQRAFRGAVGRAALGSVATIGRGAMTVGMLGGTALIASGISKQINVSKSAAALANKAFGTPGETRTREQIQTSILEQSKQIGDVTGNRAGVIEALNKVVGISGSLRGGQQMSGFMADISDATGATMEDIGSTAGIILQNLAATRGYDLGRQEDLNAAVDATQRIMGRMAGQAKIGSIEFEQLATQMASVMSATGRYTGDIEDLAAQMGAIGQLAIAGGASSPQEAMTALKRFSDDIVRNSARFKKMAQREGIKTEGVFVKNKEGKRVALKDPTQLIMEMMRVTGGDLPSVQKVFNIRSMKAFEPFQKAFTTEKARGATDEEAFAAIQKQMDRFRTANVTSDEMRTSAAFTRMEPGRELQIVFEQLRTEVGEALLPVLREMIPSLKEIAPVAGDIVIKGGQWAKWLTENPLSGLNVVIAGAMTLELAKAGIGKAFESAISGNASAMAKGLGAGLAGVSIGIATSTIAIESATISATMRQRGQTSEAKYILEKARREVSETGSMSEKTEKEVERIYTRSEAQFATAEQYAEQAETEGPFGMLSRFFGAKGGTGLAAEGTAAITNREALGEINLEAFKLLASQEHDNRVKANEEFDSFIKQANSGTNALDGFYKKLAEFETPKVPRGDKPAPPVK